MPFFSVSAAWYVVHTPSGSKSPSGAKGLATGLQCLVCVWRRQERQGRRADAASENEQGFGGKLQHTLCAPVKPLCRNS